MHVDSVLFEVCETVWMIPEHRQNPPEISCLGVLLSFQPSPALISHLALPLATSAGTVRSFYQLLALKWGHGEGRFSYFKQKVELRHAWATSQSPHKQPLWTFHCPGEPEVKLCLQLPGLKVLSDIISWQPALSKPFPTADKQCSEQSCAGRQGCSTPLGVYRLGEIGPDPKAEQKQGCHSSTPPSPTGSKAECVFPVGTHTQKAHTYAYKKIHKWLAIQIPRPHGLSGSGWDSPCPSDSQLLPQAHP